MDHDLFPPGPPTAPPLAPPMAAPLERLAPAPDLLGPAAPAAQAQSAPSTNDGWFGPIQPRDPDASPHGPMTWVAAGLSAAVITAVAVIGVHSATSSHASASPSLAPTTANGSTSANGATGASRSGGGLGPGGGAAVGTISAIHGSTLTVTNQGGTSATVRTTSSTVVTTSVTGTVADIANGDHLVVMGTTAGPTVAATGIVDRGTDTADDGSGGPPSGLNVPSGFGGGFAPVTGTVTAVNGSTVTLTTTSGSTVKVTTSSTTAVEVDRTISITQLKTGDQVVVTGTTRGTTVTATRIREGAIGIGGNGGLDMQGRGGLPSSNSSTNPAPAS
jgi:hypothetical protein